MTRLILACVFFCVGSFANAITFKNVDCTKSGFSGDAWTDITDQEPRILKALEDISTASGNTHPTAISMNNCLVRIPYDDEGKAVDGTRTVTLDKIWYSGGHSGFKRHHGIKILYRLRTYMAQGAFGPERKSFRSIEAFAICHTPESCAALGIPMWPPSEGPTTDKVDLTSAF